MDTFVTVEEYRFKLTKENDTKIEFRKDLVQDPVVLSHYSHVDSTLFSLSYNNTGKFHPAFPGFSPLFLSNMCMCIIGGWYCRLGEPIWLTLLTQPAPPELELILYGLRPPP